VRRPLALALLAGAAAAVACDAAVGDAHEPDTSAAVAPAGPVAAGQQLDTAMFAGGCFWCMEPPFDALPGVRSTTSGYAGGRTANPTYEQVSAGGTGHAEVVRVIYEPSRVSYARLLDVFWRNVDPLTANRQFCDGGDQYRSAIFALDAAQRRAADSSRAALARSGRWDRPIVTEIDDAATFWPAEEYHQDYYEKNPLRYKFYRATCGRDARLREVWGE
jgi:peptide-methionine (S)-S-oxide reductase